MGVRRGGEGAGWWWTQAMGPRAGLRRNVVWLRGEGVAGVRYRVLLCCCGRVGAVLA